MSAMSTGAISVQPVRMRVQCSKTRNPVAENRFKDK